MTVSSPNHLLSITDVDSQLEQLLEFASLLKARQKAGECYEPLCGRSLGMIFEKPSTRTRVSFEVGMTQLGGHALYLGRGDIHLGVSETIGDTARTLSRFVDIIMYRAFKNEMMRELAAGATVPVINALDDREHPCQILADLLTIKEHKGGFNGLKLAFIGDGNNVCNSLLLGCALLGIDMTVACPGGYEPGDAILAQARTYAARTGATIAVEHEPQAAVADADVVYTDVWVSMGDEAEKEKRLTVFQPYQLNAVLLAGAKPDAIVMHCLPAHRGEEITDEVIDGPQSVVFDEAENRLHAQKAAMVWLVNGDAAFDEY